MINHHSTPSFHAAAHSIPPCQYAAQFDGQSKRERARTEQERARRERNKEYMRKLKNETRIVI